MMLKESESLSTVCCVPAIILRRINPQMKKASWLRSVGFHSKCRSSSRLVSPRLMHKRLSLEGDDDTSKKVQGSLPTLMLSSQAAYLLERVVRITKLPATSEDVAAVSASCPGCADFLPFHRTLTELPKCFWSLLMHACSNLSIDFCTRSHKVVLNTDFFITYALISSKTFTLKFLEV